MIFYHEKNIKYGEISNAGRTQTFRNDVIRSVLLHIRDNLGMMLARDNASCHAARSLDLNPIDHLLDLLERKVRALC